MPDTENVRLEEGEGEMLLRTLYLSLDPYMRGRMDDVKSYSPPLAIDDVIVGGTVCRVETSRHADYRPGDLVLAYTGWQDYAIVEWRRAAKTG